MNKTAIVILSDPENGEEALGRVFNGLATAYLYNLIKDKIEGVSSGCADFFGGTEEATSNGYKLLTDNPIPGTSGLPSIRKLINSDATVLTF